MARETVRECVERVVRAELGYDAEIADESRLQEDLGADSLDMIELVMCLEEEFALDIPDEAVEAGRLRTFGDVVAWVEAQTPAAAGGDEHQTQPATLT